MPNGAGSGGGLPSALLLSLVGIAAALLLLKAAYKYVSQGHLLVAMTTCYSPPYPPP